MDDEQEEKNEFDDQDFDPRKLPKGGVADDDLIDEDDAEPTEEEPIDPLEDTEDESLDEMADKELLEDDADVHDDIDLL